MNFYDQLQEIPRWIVRDTNKQTDKERKIPLQINGKPASSTDSKTWNTYQACEKSKFNGFGFVLTSSDNIVCIDCDHCMEDGIISPYALYILKLVSSGAEISQSCTGLHIFCRGIISQAIKTKKIEVYSTGRYIAVTGNVLLNLPINPAQKALDNIYCSHKNYQKENKIKNIKIEKPIPISSTELDKLLENRRFKKLWDKEIEFLKDEGGYDWSRYDFNIALALKKIQPEKVISIQQMFRIKNDAPKKHRGALINGIQKTNEYKDTTKI